MQFIRRSPQILSLLVLFLFVVAPFSACAGISAITPDNTPTVTMQALPCDIYAAAGTPCVAAHSTVRALFATYNGPLYQVRRWSDSTTINIGTLSTGGYANAAAQDSFCVGTSCTITQIYDQSGHHNNLTIEGKGGNGVADHGANAAALPILAGGHKVYGVYVSAGVGYRDDTTVGVAKSGQPEGMYMVTSGTHVDNRCCFDYGNAETNNDDTGNGHMDAVNFSTICRLNPCPDSVPWVRADLENGLYPRISASTLQEKGNSSAFVTVLLKNNGQTTFNLKSGSAQSGNLTTWYNGPEPDKSGYRPMHQEGAIVLGTGGDNSNKSVGSFFEGVMTAGYPTDAVDNAVQANVVAIGYSSVSAFSVSGTVYRLTDLAHGKVLDAGGCETISKTAVKLQAASSNTCQQWAFSSAGNGVYIITNVHSGTALTEANCTANDNTAVYLASKPYNICQQWEIIPTGARHYELVTHGSGMVLGDANCASSNQTSAMLLRWSNIPCEEWNVAP